MPVAIAEELKGIEGSPMSSSPMVKKAKKSKKKSKKAGESEMMLLESLPAPPSAPEPLPEPEMADPEWNLVDSSGGRFNETPILYSQDAESVFSFEVLPVHDLILMD